MKEGGEQVFNFTSTSSDPGRLNKIYKETADAVRDEDFIVKEIQDFKNSTTRKDMINGEYYYNGKHDILKNKRQVIGKSGDLVEIDNLPNNKIVDNQYKKMVDQKKNYLLGKPLVFSPQSEDKNNTGEESEYSKKLKQLFGMRFQRLIKNIGEDSINCGIGWLYMNYDENGELAMKRVKPYQVIPVWSDFEHDILDAIIYFYSYKVGDDVIEKVEVHDENGIDYFILEGQKLIPAEIPHRDYIEVDGQPLNWLKIPWFPFKYNNKEVPLIKDVKSLQDGINQIVSTFKNNMDEDYRNSILILVNYDGTNLGEFRHNLSEYGAVKVRPDGDVKTLNVEVNAENYEVILKIFKNALIENAKGYDAKDDRLSGEPNQMNIQSMYSDIDLDADEMEIEYQATFEEVIEFVNWYLSNDDGKDYEGEVVDVVFNRNVLINQSEIIDNLRNSMGMISNQTILENHPFVDDAEKERNQLEAEKKKEMSQWDDYSNSFPRAGKNDVIDDEE